jgi:hypothetical protein
MDAELWTIDEVAAFVGASSTGSARKLLSRWGVRAVGRHPGRGGVSLYDAHTVRAAKDARPGQGARTDLREDETGDGGIDPRRTGGHGSARKA